MKDGGPAYPNKGWKTPNESCNGMSLRDHFAGQALAHIPQLIIAGNANPSFQMIAEWSYKVADAMLKARESK